MVLGNRGKPPIATRNPAAQARSYSGPTLSSSEVLNMCLFLAAAGATIATAHGAIITFFSSWWYCCCYAATTATTTNSLPFFCSSACCCSPASAPSLPLPLFLPCHAGCLPCPLCVYCDCYCYSYFSTATAAAVVTMTDHTDYYWLL